MINSLIPAYVLGTNFKTDVVEKRLKQARQLKDKTMKIDDKVIINSYPYEGVQAVITGFEHLNIKDNVVTIDDNPKKHSRVELYSIEFHRIKPNQGYGYTNKLYFSALDFKKGS